MAFCGGLHGGEACRVQAAERRRAPHQHHVGDALSWHLRAPISAVCMPRCAVRHVALQWDVARAPHLRQSVLISRCGSVSLAQGPQLDRFGALRMDCRFRRWRQQGLLRSKRSACRSGMLVRSNEYREKVFISRQTDDSCYSVSESLSTPETSFSQTFCPLRTLQQVFAPDFACEKGPHWDNEATARESVARQASQSWQCELRKRCLEGDSVPCRAPPHAFDSQGLDSSLQVSRRVPCSGTFAIGRGLGDGRRERI